MTQARPVRRVGVAVRALRRALVPFALAAVAVPAWSLGASIAELSLEELRDVVVVTVSRFEERLDHAPASAYVITADDIRRAGATSLPEALRLAPQLDVARADAHQYAIGARGFNNVLANKMLVLVDGRTVYTPLFSGVFWEAQDVALEDVERIEVVSGPTTALWGSNAVNGMIHVITRSALATQGPSAALHAGNRARGGGVRWGTRLGESGGVRLYARHRVHRASERANGLPVRDRGELAQGGLRADWARTGESLTLQGDLVHGVVDQPPSARHFSGANLLARWDRRLGPDRDASVQASVERTRRRHPQIFAETLETVDVVAQLGFRPHAAHQALVGAGLRQSRDDVTNFAPVAFLPAARKLTWKRLFAQDRIALPRRLSLTLAASVESNPYTGTEVLPSARLAWQARPTATAWASLSRAVRAPSRIDREFFQPAAPPFVLAGGPDFLSEVSNVLELGWRGQPGSSLSYSFTLFRHEHSRLRSVARTPAGLQFRNDNEGRTRGLEAWARWRPVAHWRLDAGGVLLRQRLATRAGAADFGGLAALGNDPRHWATLRSSLDLTAQAAWDLSVRRTGARPNPVVPAYTAVDTRLAWKPAPGTEVALAVMNLLDDGHPEWGAPANRVEHERSVQLQLHWQP